VDLPHAVGVDLRIHTISHGKSSDINSGSYKMH